VIIDASRVEMSFRIMALAEMTKTMEENDSKTIRRSRR
jgi:hypothetical protein